MKESIENVRLLFTLTTSDLQEIKEAFQEEMARGLRGEKSSLKMLPVYMGRPKGTEKGDFIVLDMGGTNFRLMKVHLNGKRGARIEAAMRQTIPKKLRQGSKEELFDFLAHHLGTFLHKCQYQDTSFAFTFSFPMVQKSVSSGMLVRWTKGFTVPGVEGEDVALLLSEALQRKGIPHLRLRALLNDTVATLLTASYQSPGFDMAVILGTGTNACYIESSTCLQVNLEENLGEEVIVNLEWGNFNRLPVNEYDHLLDISSPNPGEQRMEKMVSGLYLGELVRLILLKIKGKSSPPYSLSSKKLTSLISNDMTDPREKEIADLVFSRSAQIVAATIVAVITWLDPHVNNHHRVAVDGALFTGYRRYRKRIEEFICQLLPNKGKLIELYPIKSGSGIGAAVACAMN
ncbi:MAG: hypothetical protein N2572_03605 [Syntrophales bacterium]|nr:hypothetical protein [Syntrophales bacterium]